MSYKQDLSTRRAEYIIKGVFSKLWFPSQETRNILYDSYIANIPVMNNYAIGNNIGIRKYYNGIRDILLLSPGITEAKQKHK